MDMHTRLVARYLPNYVPGSPRVIVQNMTGGARVIALNFLYNLTESNGLTIGHWHTNIALPQVLTQPGVKYDARRFVYLGALAAPPRAILAHRDVPYRTIKELMNAPPACLLNLPLRVLAPLSVNCCVGQDTT